MKKLFIIANWKSHKTNSEADKWFSEFKEKLSSHPLDLSNKEVIICPSYSGLGHAKKLSEELSLPIKIGSQDMSPFEEGAYTGEVSGAQLKELADYSIVGHSERREYFKETDELVSKKAEMARKYAVIPIFCIQDENTPIPENISIIAYEPPSAIGTGRPDTPEDADEVAHNVKEKNKAQFVLYGGSVKADNVKSFSDMANVDGFLVGGASLDASEFFEIVKNA